MRTVKLVVIGASGVGKTSLRNQYISGRFTTGYRATIGADFITKSLPHYSCPEESVTLQIWDTAGQERFSSLSSAFFRGADAAILMFDVNQPDTLNALTKWWSEFRERAPVLDEEVEDFCCVVVGNKIDMLGEASEGNVVTERDALHFIHELVPPSSAPPSPIVEPPEIEVNGDSLDPNEEEPPRTGSIDIGAHHRRASKSRSGSRSTFFRGGTMGTMTTTHTVFHTPSSSLFDAFESALSSPARTATSYSRSPSQSPTRIPRRVSSSSSISTAPTITPSLFVRQATTVATTPLSGSPSSFYSPPPPRERRPKLFFTSAKTGTGVTDVFEYVARRVVVRWEYEEALEARTLHMQEASDTIRLTHAQGDRKWGSASCCA
ncbi:ras-domain-containing protein [Amylocystis lapponica]|nr:ras-domain-containing protein [Amylocystis lapponica]